MTEDYKVIFSGKCIEGKPEHEVVDNLAKFFNSTPEVIRKKLFSGSKIIVKKGDRDLAERFRASIEEAGGICEIVSNDKKRRSDLQKKAVQQSAPARNDNQTGTWGKNAQTKSQGAEKPLSKYSKEELLSLAHQFTNDKKLSLKKNISDEALLEIPTEAPLRHSNRPRVSIWQTVILPLKILQGGISGALAGFLGLIGVWLLTWIYLHFMMFAFPEGKSISAGSSVIGLCLSLAQMAISFGAYLCVGWLVSIGATSGRYLTKVTRATATLHAIISSVSAVCLLYILSRYTFGHYEQLHLEGVYGVQSLTRPDDGIFPYLTWLAILTVSVIVSLGYKEDKTNSAICPSCNIPMRSTHKELLTGPGIKLLVEALSRMDIPLFSGLLIAGAILKKKSETPSGSLDLFACNSCRAGYVELGLSGRRLEIGRVNCSRFLSTKEYYLVNRTLLGKNRR